MDRVIYCYYPNAFLEFVNDKPLQSLDQESYLTKKDYNIKKII